MTMARRNWLSDDCLASLANGRVGFVTVQLLRKHWWVRFPELGAQLPVCELVDSEHVKQLFQHKTWNEVQSKKSMEKKHAKKVLTPEQKTLGACWNNLEKHTSRHLWLKQSKTNILPATILADNHATYRYSMV